jgi:hypothetical protein
MSVFRRAVAVFTGGLLLASIVGAIGARAAKDLIERVEDPEVRVAAIFEPICFHSTASDARRCTPAPLSR